MDLFVAASGSVQCLYTEDLALDRVGHLSIRRASFVEPLDGGQWSVDLSPLGGLQLGPFARRSQALAAEAAWIEHWLNRGG